MASSCVSAVSMKDEAMNEEEIAQCCLLRRHSVAAESFNPDDDDGDVAKVIHPKTDQQRQRLIEATAPILLFRSLDEDQMGDVVDAMFEKRVKAGENVILQGDDGDNFYIIESGEFDVTVKDLKTQSEKIITQYCNTGSFGELALMYNTSRAATITARTGGILWAMDRVTFRRIILKSAAQKRRMYESFLENVSLLKELNCYERINVADALTSRIFNDGDVIIKEGEKGAEMFFVEDGQVRISRKDKNNAELPIQILKKGQYFGELALITQKPRAASAFAIGKTKVAVLDVASFERLLGPCLDVMQRNISSYETQLAECLSKDNP